METLPEDITYAEETTNEKEQRSTEETRETPILSQDAYGSSYRVNASDLDSRSSFSNLDSSSIANVWHLTINGEDYNVLFPKTEDLIVVDGVLVNIGTSNITGTVIGSSINLSTYFKKTYTVMPITGSNAQNNAYRYGGHAYLTTYSAPAQGYSLATVNDYGDALVHSKGRFGSTWNSVNIIIIGLLALQVLISFIGGLLKRD